MMDMLCLGDTCPFKVEITDVKDLKYPPTRNRRGQTRYPNDIKTVIWIKTNIVKVPTLVTSDLHSHSEAVFNDLEKLVKLSDYQIITLGDMAGDMIYGSDGDPTPTYQRLNKQNNLYIVQGNHDLPPRKIRDLIDLRNINGTRSYLPDGTGVVDTPNGKIGCVHGTISFTEHPYKKPHYVFYKLVENILKKRPKILLTHETPAIKYTNTIAKKYNTPEGEIVDTYLEQESAIGKDGLFDLVTKYKVPIHIYGHCHHRKVMVYVNGTLFINVDGRVLLLHPM